MESTFWIDGLSASAVVLSGIGFGLLFYLHARNNEATLLKLAGYFSILGGLLFLGVFLDFIWVLTTGQNIPNDTGIIGWISYMWYPPMMTVAILIAVSVLKPEWKKLSLGIFAILGLIFEIVLIIQPLQSFYFVYPPSSGENLVDYNINPTSIAGIMVILLMVPVLIFNGLGFLHGIMINKGGLSQYNLDAKKEADAWGIRERIASGEIKNNFIFLFLAVVLFGFGGAMESLTEPGILLVIVRAAWVCSFIFMYLGSKSS